MEYIFIFIVFICLCYWVYDYKNKFSLKYLVHDKNYGKVAL